MLLTSLAFMAAFPSFQQWEFSPQPSVLFCAPARLGKGFRVQAPAFGKCGFATETPELRHWYLLRAKSYLTRRLAEIACTLDWLNAVPELKLVPMRQQWGSCTPAGAIHLNPALIRAPRVCLDYVLLHELCHVREHNHSKRFYALLSKHSPNWQETKLELDKLAELLLVD